MATTTDTNEGNTKICIALDNTKESLKAIDFVLSAFPAGPYHLLHVQTRPIASSLVLADADMALLAFEGQKEVDKERLEVTERFMEKIFIPRAASKGAQVEATILKSDPDGAGAIGDAICDFLTRHKPAAVVLLRQNTSAVSRFFMGSVSRHVAVHSPVAAVIVPP